MARGMIAGIADLLGPERPYYLFDSFEGLPPAQPVDGAAALAWQANTTSPNYHDNCSASVESAQAAMAMSRGPDYKIIKGWFQATLPEFVPAEPVAILRLDADWFESTMICLKSLYKYMSKGGIIILDDYYTWDGCSRAVHRFLADHDLPVRVREPFSGVCVLQNEA
jgi:O-methyltransferase